MRVLFSGTIAVALAMMAGVARAQCRPERGPLAEFGNTLQEVAAFRERPAPSRMTGVTLKTFVFGIEHLPTRPLLRYEMFRELGMGDFLGLRLGSVPPTWLPSLPLPGATRRFTPPDLPALFATDAGEGFRPETISALSQAYARGETDPVAVARRLIARRRSDPTNAFSAMDEADLLRQAEASAARYRAGSPLSPLDGIPIAVKDQIDVAGYRTGVGTKFLDGHPKEDATIVARLRAAGAILVGKTNMDELGMGVTGLNASTGTVRNPYDLSRATGGSSSGSAAAVSSGLVPGAVGSDAGGSTRIPAALTGVVGLKPTWGRMSQQGVYPLAPTLQQPGPIGATVRDVAILFSAMAGPDPADPATASQPAIDLSRLDRTDLKGLVVGVPRSWTNQASPEVVAALRALEDRLRARGATIREIQLPGVEAFDMGHLATVAREMASSQAPYRSAHRKDYGYDVRGNLALADGLTQADATQAARLRTLATATFQDALTRCDVILTPATSITAPPIPADALTTGESDLGKMRQIARYTTAANLTGLPALTFPAGYDGQGLPVGAQLIGRAWDEGTLLAVGRSAEQGLVRKGPPVYEPAQP